MTAREYFKQNDCQGVLQSKAIMLSDTINRTVRECHNQKHCQGVLQSIEQGVPQSKALPGSATIGWPWNATLKHFQGVLQSIRLSVSVTIINTARDCYNK